MGMVGLGLVSEWIAGARMKIVVNGVEGSESAGMGRGASKLSN